MSTEDLLAAVMRQPSPWQIKQIELRTSERRIAPKVECRAHCWLKSEPCGGALSRGSPAENQREARLNQKSAQGRVYAGVEENSVAVLVL